MLPDHIFLDILDMYECGWDPPEIAEELDLPCWAVREIIETDDWLFPEEPLRERVLH